MKNNSKSSKLQNKVDPLTEAEFEWMSLDMAVEIEENRYEKDGDPILADAIAHLTKLRDRAYERYKILSDEANNEKTRT